MKALLSRFAHDDRDTENIRLAKLTAIIVAGSCCVAGAVWALMYYCIFGFGITTVLPASFTVIVGSCIVLSHKTRNHLWAVYAQIICIIYITSFIQWSIGGVFDSGFVMAWAFCGPVTALTFFSLRQSFFWLLLFLVNIAITVVFDGYFSAGALPVTHATRNLFFVMNIGVSSITVFAFASFFVSQTLKERARAETLLHNILPRSIAKKLKDQTGTIAEKHEDVSVLFADLVGFTSYTSQATADELVQKLDLIFNHFDQLSQKYKLEKIKTIGDGYMVAGGIPDSDPDHKYKIARLALDMVAELHKLQKDSQEAITLRVGIHSGPVIAGVIGQSKIAYDLWGDTVNIASRLESSGASGVIHVSGAFRKGLEKHFEFEDRGDTELRGKGKMKTFYLTALKLDKDTSSN